MNHKRPPFYLVVTLIFVITALHLAAMKFHLYWSFWWFDMLLHFLGGAWVALAALWLYYISEYKKERQRQCHSVFWIALGATFVIGLSWEVFEFSLDKFIVFADHDIVDTGSDLVMDMLGAVLAGVYFKNKGYHKIMHAHPPIPEAAQADIN